jgi:hypothetical protein
VFTIITEAGEMAFALHLKIPQRTHPWRDTGKREVREEQEKEEGVDPALPRPGS